MKLTRLNTALLSAFGSIGLLHGQENESALEIIEVTATKQTQNIQETPITVNALSSQDLADNNIGNFDDVARYIPNITLGGRGPGQSDIFIRGLAIQPIAVQLSGAQGTMPNVALYVDEQPVTAPGRNLDVYATDLERIEVLPGPQGTLFGASSQAGTIRYITKKPILDGIEGSIVTGVGTTHSGDESYQIEGFLNVPLNESFAVRLAAYSIHRGGYIDNIRGQFSLDPNINPNIDLGLGPTTTYTTVTNDSLAEEDFNSGGYDGFRLSAKYWISANWSLLIQQHEQRLESDGVFDVDPTLDDLQVTRFFPDRLQDDFSQTNWTLEGRLAKLEALYTGAYFNREVEQTIDYTGYNNAGAFIAYYTCTYTNPNYVVNYNIAPELITSNRECKNPVKGFDGKQEHQRQTHELRFSGKILDKVRATFGVFYDDFKIETQDDFIYLSAEELGFAPNAPISTARSINPSVRPAGVTFFNDITRTEEQLAIFTEVSFDVTEALTLTLGLRWYDIESDFYGSSNFADGIFQGSVNTDRGRDYDRSGGHTTEPLSFDDIIPKVNLSFKQSKQVLWYATYSEGFRPGGFNRGGGIPSTNPSFPDVNLTYSTDEVINYELGWKALLYEQSLKINGNLYFIQWDNMQVSRFDPANVSILTFIENAADSEIKGFEADLAWAVDDNFTLFGAFSYNDAELVAVDARVIEIAPIGSELPLTPTFQGNLRLKNEWEWKEYLINWQLAVQYADSSFSSIVQSERQTQSSYHLVNLSVGVESEQWHAKLYIDNVFDERPELFKNDQDDILRITTSRPRTLGLQIGYRFD